MGSPRLALSTRSNRLRRSRVIVTVTVHDHFWNVRVRQRLAFRRTAAFRAEAHRQSGAVAGSAQEQDDQAFIDAISDRGQA
ncbi:MAG: DUF3018 family protein [Acidobacteria bacterium]|nr:DUF3018 family protein [Acidobacteriota bacterium]